MRLPEGGLVDEGETVRAVPHPLSTHDVEGCVREEAGKVHTAVKQRHHMRNVTRGGGQNH